MVLLQRTRCTVTKTFWRRKSDINSLDCEAQFELFSSQCKTSLAQVTKFIFSHFTFFLLKKLSCASDFNFSRPFIDRSHPEIRTMMTNFEFRETCSHPSSSFLAMGSFVPTYNSTGRSPFFETLSQDGNTFSACALDLIVLPIWGFLLLRLLATGRRRSSMHTKCPPITCLICASENVTQSVFAIWPQKRNFHVLLLLHAHERRSAKNRV